MDGCVCTVLRAIGDQDADVDANFDAGAGAGAMVL